METAIAPWDIANQVFERIVQSLSDPMTLSQLKLNYFAKIQDEMLWSEIKMETTEERRFLKSTARQLACLKETYEKNPSGFNADGDWILKKGHGNQILTEVEEAAMQYPFIPVTPRGEDNKE